MIVIRPVNNIEDLVYQRILSNIPAGDFYVRSNYTLPIYNGDGITPFEVLGEIGHTATIYLNNTKFVKIALLSNKERVLLKLAPVPNYNHIKIVDDVDSSDDSISVVIANYATVHSGISKIYFNQLWLPNQLQNWSLTSPWSGRLIEFLFPYHQLFPDTQAMRVLAVRLTSRAVWNDGSSTVGIESLLGSLTCGIPVFIPVSNMNSSLDWALYPPLPPQSDYSGFEFDVWYQDQSLAKEEAFKLFASNFPSIYEIKGHKEGITQLQFLDKYLELVKERPTTNLSDLFKSIGAMDYVSSFVTEHVHSEIVWRYYTHEILDKRVIYPLTGSRVFDTSYLDRHFHDPTLTLDSDDIWTSKWLGSSIFPLDTGEVFDSKVQRSVCYQQTADGPSYGGEWNYTKVDTATTTAEVVTNTLHGGAPPSYVYKP